MFQFSYGANPILVVLVWILVLGLLMLTNELTRKFKWVGFFAFFILPVILTALWFTVLRDSLYIGWFHMVKVYTATITCIGFWLIRHHPKLGLTKFALFFPPAILAINIVQAVIRDFELGLNYSGMGALFNEGAGAIIIAGPWNFMNGVAGILNIIAITGFMGITLRKVTEKDKSKSILWSDMLWFYIIAYNFWNFAYVYNAIPHRSWYNGLALLIAPTIIAFTTGRGSWVQHRGHTLALWVYFALTFPMFLDDSIWRVDSVYNPDIQFAVSFISLLSNMAIVIYMIYKWKRTKRNPYTSEVFADLEGSKKVKALSS